MPIQSYYEKYQNLSEKWGIDEDKVLKILDKFCIKLADELIDLVINPLELPPYMKDRRTPEQYIENIISGWLIEDLVCEWFKSRGHSCELAGDDKDRVIQKKYKRKISSVPDLLVDNKPVELQVSLSGRRNTYHIKLNKAKKIERGENVLLFIVENEYFVVDREIISSAEEKPLPAWGNKIVKELKSVKYKLMKEQINIFD